ncbi:nitroreductase family protein [Clostridium sp. KNHs205]|uniref:nitroreductase family protein n=1 Tax=Clostridium sp. KNHs205 TaxID=1449050 RepID=UPI00068DB5CE|nr:nitroreductase family protein [Clostridium sp. KNHs205]
MKLEFPVEKTIKTRSSIRTYEEKPLDIKVKQQIKDYIAALSNPFSVEVKLQLLETASSNEKLGTYGVIKGARDYIGATVSEVDLNLEAVGYSFEKLILYLANLGIGTCWLGGTFNRNQFSNALEVKANELFPAISPIGYPLEKKRLADTLIRKIAKSDQRKNWNELFFLNDFSVPLTQEEAKEFAFPLEMVRLGPSASNKQPWRIVKAKNGFHFYEAKAPGYSDKLSLDIQRVDVGIAACHFHVAALEKDLPGKFEKLSDPGIIPPADNHYIFSYVLL